jgi:hypothetical protein
MMEYGSRTSQFDGPAHPLSGHKVALSLPSTFVKDPDPQACYTVSVGKRDMRPLTGFGTVGKCNGWPRFRRGLGREACGGQPYDFGMSMDRAPGVRSQHGER